MDRLFASNGRPIALEKAVLNLAGRMVARFATDRLWHCFLKGTAAYRTS